ncbi:uncharacterized protein K02A2.6-like [Amphibalanus amphitrite]|uniref:uncharacterized protein K02A2.6-like n=1 Tax=Amphibalanus amphitrite TaxID=1232801 RepID=UPI001C905BA2|nr:uncharacterized protein K02A2.6-like [Amphibalanus amphitrite]
MSLDGVQPPAPFLPSPGKPAVDWQTWEGKFVNYLLAISGDTFNPARQRAVLLHCVGDEAYRLYGTLPPGVKADGETDFDLALRQLREFYTPRTNVIVERFNFRQRGQHDSETTADFVSALRGLARTCEFGAITDELIRDVVVEKTVHPRLRERFLQDKDLTLEKVLVMAEAFERSLREAAAMAPPALQLGAVAKVSTGPRRRTTQPSLPSPATQCTNCGRKDHQPRDKSCPAKKVVCHQCGRKGHFASWCRSKEKPPACKELQVLSCSTSTSSKMTCTASVTASTGVQRDVLLQVDTGASCSILSMDLARKLFKGVPYESSTASLYGFAKTPLSVKGTLPTVVRFNGQEATTDFFLVETPNQEAIMGLNLINALGITLHPASNSIYSVEAEAQPLPAIEHYEHRIVLKPGATPTAYRLRRLPLSVREEVSAELQRLLHDGIIEKIDASEWVSPLAVSRRKDGRIRVCVDLRGPNSQIVAEVHPLPTIDELESKLHGSVYSRIDLKTAYHQLRLHKDSRDITAFLTPDGLMRYTRVPFGLVSSGSAFQKLLSSLLKGVPGCGHYLDDILVSGKDHQEHDTRLKEVMDRLARANVTINKDKSVFRQTSIEFCGHKLSAAGVVPLQSTVRAVIEAPPPSDARELRSFLGTTGWFSRFVPAYASVVRPMAHLLKKDAPFQWSEEQQAAFNKVKQLISTSPVMRPFDPHLQTIVTSDASDRGAGAVLTQVQPSGEERPVAYWSRSFTEAESRYSVSEKEALSAVNAVEHWRIYLWGRFFKLKTDHSALTTLLTPKSSNRAGARIARWQARLLPYSYSVEYKPGHTIPVADALSRLPLPDTSGAETDGDDIIALVTDDATDALPESEIRAASEADPALSEVREAIRTGWPASARECSPTLRPFFDVRHELQLRDDNIILRGPDRVVVPLALIDKYLQVAHRSHEGIVRTKQLLRSLAWWPGMMRATTDLIRDCSTCQAKDAVLSQGARPAPLQPVPLPDRAWSKLGIDVVGPIAGAPPSARYAITVIDYASKWPEVALTSSVETDDVISFLSSLWSREGYCDELVSDNGPQFTSAKFEKYLSDRGIQHRKSSLYWPRGNAAVERFNRTLKTWLLEAAQQSPRTPQAFAAHVTRRLALYRTVPHCTTGISPSEGLHGRRMRLDLPVMSADSAPDAGLHTRVQTQQRRNERNYNRRRGVKVPTIQPGDKVRVRRPGHTPKNLSRFGPTQTVVRRLGKATFLLSDGTRYNASHLALAPAASSAETSDGDSPAAGLDPLPTVADQRETAHAPRPVTPRREGLPAVRGDPPGSPAPDGRRSATPAPVDSPRSPHRSGNELPPSSFGRRRFQPRKLAT